MSEDEYPEIIRRLPEADIPFKGVRGWILQGVKHQVVFMDIEPIGEVAEHTHGEQWGVAIDGEMDLTIGGETRLIKKGDSYHIPAGVPHSAIFRTRFKALDFFADRDRYKPK
jgi:quercetin dioxygenase-like cupin family protein